VMLAVGGEAGAGAGPRLLGGTAACFLWQPVTAAMRTRVEARIVALRNLISVVLIRYLLLKL
jgi:hypothetical protein